MLLERLSRQVLATPYSQQVLAAGCRRLGRRLGAGMVSGRAARAVPLVGGVVGGTLNVAMVRGAGRRAQGHYRALLLDWQDRRRDGALRVAQPRPSALGTGAPALPAGEPSAQEPPAAG